MRSQLAAAHFQFSFTFRAPRPVSKTMLIYLFSFHDFSRYILVPGLAIVEYFSRHFRHRFVLNISGFQLFIFVVASTLLQQIVFSKEVTWTQ